MALEYDRQPMQAILHGHLPIDDIVNTTTLSLEDAASGCKPFDGGAARTFVLGPHVMPGTATGATAYRCSGFPPGRDATPHALRKRRLPVGNGTIRRAASSQST